MSMIETPYALVPAQEPTQAPTPEGVARWLFDEIRRREGSFTEETAALEITRLFGGPFVYARTSGELAVGSSVRRALRQIAGERVRWDSALRGWRLVP